MVAPAQVKIVEVGPRDGLQNEAKPVPTAIKVELIDRLAAAGCRHIEAGSFVSPKKIPQLADSAEVFRQIRRAPGVIHAALTPNLRGFRAALAAGADEVAVFASASETFSRKNIDCGIDESFSRFEPVMAAAQAARVRVRGYVSCALGCPYEGEIAHDAVARVALRLDEMGCYEISLGDTIGIGAPLAAQRMIEAVAKQVGVRKLAGHFHDTFGMAAANVLAAMQMGVTVFDGSVGGLGGCPYAKGATGNVATELLVYMMRGMGVETGIDLMSLADCADWISALLGRAPSRVARALKNRGLAAP